MQILKPKWRDLLFLIIGSIIATVLNNWAYFTFSREISIADLFTAVLGAFIGIYVASKLTSIVSAERIERDLLINEISPVKPILSQLYSSLDSDTLVLEDAVRHFKTISQILNAMRTSVKMCKPNKDIDLKILSGLNKIRQISRNATGLPITASRILIVPPADQLMLLNDIKAANEIVTTIIFQVNRL